MIPNFLDTIQSDFLVVKQAWSNPPTTKPEKDKAYLSGARLTGGFLMITGGFRVITVLYSDGKAWSFLTSAFAFTLGHDLFVIALKISEVQRNLGPVTQAAAAVEDFLKNVFAIVHPQNDAANPMLYIYQKTAEKLSENTLLPSFWVNTHQYWTKQVVEYFLKTP